MRTHTHTERERERERRTHIHSLDDWPESRHRSTNSHSEKGIFTDGRIQEPHFAILLIEVEGHLVTAAVVADIFAHETHLYTEREREREKEREKGRKAGYR